jgi:hypothetical protein
LVFDVGKAEKILWEEFLNAENQAEFDFSNYIYVNSLITIYDQYRLRRNVHPLKKRQITEFEIVIRNLWQNIYDQSIRVV